MAISDFEIVAYRGLRGTKLESPARVNLLVGANNTGKTSVLEAIALYAKPLDAIHWAYVAGSRETRQARVDVLQALDALCPRLGDDARSVEFRGVARHGVVAAGGVLTAVEGHAGFGNGAFGSAPFGGGVVDRGVRVDLWTDTSTAPTPPGSKPKRVSASLTIWENQSYEQAVEVEQPTFAMKMLPSAGHTVAGAIVKVFSEAVEARRKPDLLEALRQFDAEIEGIDLIERAGFGPSLVVTHAKLGVLPLASFGDGMRRTVALVAAVIAAKGGVLLVDEIETAIHVRALAPVFRQVLDIAAATDVQIFATTHSLEAVDAIASVASGDALAAYHLKRDGGVVRAHRYKSSDLRYLRHQRGLDIR